VRSRGKASRSLDRGKERLCVFNEMICRKDEQQRVFAQCHCLHRRQRDSWRRVAPVRFEQQACLDFDLTQLLGDDKPMIFAAHNYRLANLFEAFEALERVLKERAVYARYLNILFWQQCSRDWPQTRTHTARNHYRD